MRPKNNTARFFRFFHSPGDVVFSSGGVVFSANVKIKQREKGAIFIIIRYNILIIHNKKEIK